MNPATGDGLRVLLSCEPGTLEATVAFYRETLGFELEHRQDADDGALVGLRLDGSRVLLATPGAFDLAPKTPSVGTTVILMHPDVAAHRRALGARYQGWMGPLSTMGGGVFYALADPSGNPVWIMQID
ncbi:MAG: VOC family protein [Myxococcota bacterium]|nr:VOC family protein [Myxococcota bacterium]